MSARKKAEKGFKKFGKRTALLYAGLVIALCAAFAVAKNAAAFRLTPKEADETQIAAPSVKFDASDLAPYTQSSETTAAPTEPNPTETQPDEQAVVAQEDGIARAEHFSMPLLSEVDKPFSGGDMVQSKTMGDWRVHNGVDFRGTVGDQVRAVNNGVVKAVYDDVLWGTVVEIDHGNGLVARYCGLGKGSTAAVGDKVKINDRIGNLGSVPVESADEVHLHFEMRQDGTAVDPMPILES